MRMAERALGVWAARLTPSGTAAPQDLISNAPKRHAWRRRRRKRTLRQRSLYRLLRMVTAPMTLDVWIFGVRML